MLLSTLRLAGVLQAPHGSLRPRCGVSHGDTRWPRVRDPGVEAQASSTSRMFPEESQSKGGGALAPPGPDGPRVVQMGFRDGALARADGCSVFASHLSRFRVDI